MTKQETFSGGMAALCAAFNRESSPALLEGYWLVLGAVASPALAAGFARALGECRFMPVPAEMLRLCGVEPRDHAADAVLAWQAVRSAMDGLDVYGNPDFGPLVNAVVRNIGGWIYLCEARLPDLEWRRKDFERVYKLLAEKDPATLQGAPLFGEWRHAPVTAIDIPGQSPRPRMLPELVARQAEAVNTLVRELADAKS